MFLLPSFLPRRQRIISLALMLLSAMILAPALSAQPTVSGIINGYYEVTDMTASCTITLAYTGGLSAGDRILIIQMQGATIKEIPHFRLDEYGETANGYGNAGLWEMNTVSGVAGLRVSLKERLVNAYTPGPGRVQVLRVPSYADVTINGTLNAIPWNGTTGGIVALEATGTIDMQADIDVSGTGLLGGTSLPGNNARFCSNMDLNNVDAGMKGGSVAAVMDTRTGRGNPINGGGGGANHNAGGGGGGGGGAGGRGGAQFQGPQCPSIFLNGGIGGHAITYPVPGDRIMMGGGGGGGHVNNGGNSTGGRGGGIVLLLRGNVRGNGHAIISNGGAANAVPDDGAGGGGGGGTIMFACNSVIGPIDIVAQGGRGGDVTTLNELLGPGGGGGGGAVFTPAGGLPSTPDLTGGQPGIANFNGDPHGALPGDVGITMAGPGLNFPEGNGPTDIGLRIKTGGPISFCKGGSVTLDAGAGFNDYSWIDPNQQRSNGQTINATVSGTYEVTVTTRFGCQGVDNVKVTVWDPPDAHAGPDIPPCDSKKFQFIGLDASGGTPPYSYTWTPAAGLSDPTVSHPLAKPDKTTTYTLTVTDAHGCIGTDEVIVNVVTPLKVDMPTEVSTCAGTPIAIGNLATGGTPGYGYQWKPTAGLDNATYAKPLANPAQTTTYYLRVEDFNGCVYLDTIIVIVKPLPPVSAGQDLILCRGAAVQLSASAGAAYHWTPAAGLSCADCRSPIASPTVTTQYIVAVTDSTGCTATDTVLLAVRTPRIASTQPSVDFGSLVGCTTSAEQAVVLRNDDSADIDIDRATFSDPGFALLSPPLPIHIRAHDSIAIRLRFSPVVSGTSTGRLTLSALCATELAIDLRGVKPTTAIAAQPAVIAFGSSLSCQSTQVDTTIVISNTGTAPLTVERESVAAPFAVIGPALPRTIAPGDTIHLVLRYVPSAVGSFNAELLLPFEAGACSDTLRVSLNALRQQPQASASLSAIDFPPLLGCDAQRDTSISVVNRGSVPISIDKAIAGGGFGGFAVIGGMPSAAIAPGDSIALTIRFTPQQQGASAARLALLVGPCGDTLAIDLSGSKQGISFQVPDSIDFGELVDCVGSSLTRNITITNTSDGGVDGSVRLSSITGSSGVFSSTIVDGAALPNGVAQNFTISFSPTADGVVSGRVDLTLEPCGIQRSIALSGRRSSAALAAVAPLSLPPVPAGSVTSGQLRFRNAGSAAVTIDRIDGISPPFVLSGTQPTLPALLQPGEELIATIEVSAPVGASQQTLRAVASLPCALSAEAVVHAEGIPLGGATTISLASLSAAPGERVRLPLTMTSSGVIAPGSTSSYRATLRFNRTLLIPLTPPISDAISGEDRVVTYAGQNAAGGAGTVATIEFTAALGDTMATAIHLEGFVWNDAAVGVTTGDGVFTLSDICLTGGQRLINAEGTLSLKEATPNPAGASTEIAYEIVEDGRTQLVVSDLLGRRVATLVDGELKAGSYVVHFNTREMATGTYFYTLRTPTGSISRMMQVRK